MVGIGIALYLGIFAGLWVACLAQGVNPAEKIAGLACEIWHGFTTVLELSLRKITGRKRPDYRRIAELEQSLFKDSNR